jgi:hypothetical protein
MGNLVRTPNNTVDRSQQVTVIVADNRYQSVAQLYYLAPSDQGYQPIQQPSAGTRQFSVEILSSVSTARNILSLGYDISDAFIMNGTVLSNQEDEKIELIRNAYRRFKIRFDGSFLQTERQFSENPQFFNFQNFFAKNAFSVNLIESLIDTRNSLVYSSNTQKQENNQVLFQNSFFGSTPSNLSLIQAYYENVLSYPMPPTQTLQSGLESIQNFYEQINGSSSVYTIQAVISTENPINNNNSNQSSPKISLKRNVVLQPTMNDGIVIGIMNPNAFQIDNPIFSFTERAINPLSYTTYFVNPLTFGRIGVDYATILSSRRMIRKSNIGFNVNGGGHEIQNRTPFINNIEKKSYFIGNALNNYNNKNLSQISSRAGKVMSVVNGQSQITFIQ